MRKALGVAATAIVAATTLGAQTGTATATGAPAEAAPTVASDPAEAALSALADRDRVARATATQEFLPTATLRDADGSTHVRMERTVHGLSVIGGDLVVHQDADSSFEGATQTLRAPLDLTTKPALGAVAATSEALAPTKVTRTIKNLRADAQQDPVLVIDALGTTPRLAWQVATAGRLVDGTPSRLTTHVDARSGEVIRRVEGIHTAEGSGESLYSGTVPIEVTASGSGFALRDSTRGGAVTTDMNNREDSFLCTLLGVGCSNGTVFSGPDTAFGNGAASNRESAAVDAHYGAATTFDYFSEIHGRAGIFGDGTGVPSRVHYGNNYVNAFWDGEKMTYGDGNGTTFGPLVSLDVAGHEMSHGITENTAGLVYSGESGGLNEATSDIFGTMVEFYAANSADPADYYIGEEFDLANGEGFRRMDDPQLDGDSQSCYDASTKNIDVHFSSGVGNHFFYLLAEGSGAKTIGGKQHSSPTCDGSSVSGIGRDDAQRIWFRALDVYMTSGTTYAQARTATIDAAGDLFGAGSTQAASVASAWSAVNVG